MFKGLGGFGDLLKMMEIVQQMQIKMVEMQDGFVKLIVIGEFGVGFVKVMVMVKGELMVLDIDFLIFVVLEKEVVEDLIFVVIKDVQCCVQDKVQDEMVWLICEMGLFVDMKMFF